MRIIGRTRQGRSCRLVVVLIAAGASSGAQIGANADCLATEIPASRQDCDGDGMLDACELQINSVVTYQLDDGTTDSVIIPAPPVSPSGMIWLNQFRVVEGANEIVGIDVVWSPWLETGSPATVAIWSDPNNDGYPDDAVLLLAVETTIVDLATNVFSTIVIPPVSIAPVGASFFVGCFIPDGVFGVPLDQTPPSQLRSWLKLAQAIEDLASTRGNPLDLMDFGFPGNWLVRARTAAPADCNADGLLDDCQIVSGARADLDGNGVLDSCEDCDADGTPDGLELSRGEEQDCNGNNLPDSCDVASGEAEDCNVNGVPDECEVAFPFSIGSGYLSPIGAGSPQSLMISHPPPSAGNVTVSVKASGDFGFTSEFLTVSINGISVGTLFQDDGEDCDLPPPQVSMTIPQSIWMTAVGDGDAIITTTASPGVDPDICYGISAILIAVSYLTQGSADADLDGQVDICGPSQLADLNRDGDIDGLDLALLLGVWTSAAAYSPCPPHAPADLNHDCKVNGLDLALLLGAWG